MEAIITIVGFLGAGKTTLLKQLVTSYLDQDWNPFVILNDYESAHLDVQPFAEHLDPKCIRALSGSCICCSGLQELRDFVNSIPERPHGITLIEANGTSDACALMGFLGVGLNDRFLPPIQVSVVDVKNWQQRGAHNELEANQIQVSSLIVLTHTDQASAERQSFVVSALRHLNPAAEIVTMDKIDVSLLAQYAPTHNIVRKLEHHKAHWASCSTDLPDLPDEKCIFEICDALPQHILRVKGCTRIGNKKSYTYFERTPDGGVSIKSYYGEPTTGTKLLTVGPGSEPTLLKKAIENSLAAARARASH